MNATRDVRFALKFKVGKSRRPLTDTERDMVADAIVEHIRLCNRQLRRHGHCRGPGRLALMPRERPR
jgi:hypothetical protein